MPVTGYGGALKTKSSTTSSRDAAPLGIAPLTIFAILAFVLHVASGVMLDRSHAGTMAVLADETSAAADARSPRPPLPYD